jgi:hypothetical protein
MKVPIYDFTEEIRPGLTLRLKRYREDPVDKKTGIAKEGGYVTALICGKHELRVAHIIHPESAKWAIKGYAKVLDKAIAHWEVTNFVPPSSTSDIETFAQAIALTLK